MSALPVSVLSLPAMLVLGLLAWVIASARRNVGLVDIFWPLFFLVAALTYARSGGTLGTRALLVLTLVTAWALRLAIYLALRNGSKPEDYRYQAIRARNDPGFVWKSLYLVFGLQVALAWIISLPLAAAISSKSAVGALDAVGLALTLFGLAYESIADFQLAKFKSRAASAGRVMNQGLWRYSRHPNYFGECCVWWGFYLLALSAGAWWCLYSPLLMTILLLKVSGVALLEKTIGERRPSYLEYIACTNAFVPGPVRK